MARATEKARKWGRKAEIVISPLTTIIYVHLPASICSGAAAF